MHYKPKCQIWSAEIWENMGETKPLQVWQIAFHMPQSTLVLTTKMFLHKDPWWKCFPRMQPTEWSIHRPAHESGKFCGSNGTSQNTMWQQVPTQLPGWPATQSPMPPHSVLPILGWHPLNHHAVASALIHATPTIPYSITHSTEVNPLAPFLL